MLRLALPALLLFSAAAGAEPAVPAPPFGGLAPSDGQEGVPIDTLLWTAGERPVLIGPEGEVELELLASFFGVTAFVPAADLEPLAAYSVLSEDESFTFGSFTTGSERAPPPEPPEVVDTQERDTRNFLGQGGRFVDVEVAWEGALLVVDPDGETLADLSSPTQISEFDTLSFALPGPVDKRLVAVNLAGELSDETAFTYTEEGGCSAAPGAPLALVPILLMLGRRRRREV